MTVTKEGMNTVVSERISKKAKVDTTINTADDVRTAPTSKLIDVMLGLGSIGFNKLNKHQEWIRVLIKEQLKMRALSENSW